VSWDKSPTASGATHGSAAEVESEVCSSCEGYGSITYNPNLNPNAFPAITSAKCTHCGGTGRVEQAKPQPNDQAHL
jgi:DnaJ-class molecular chaperone